MMDKKLQGNDNGTDPKSIQKQIDQFLPFVYILFDGGFTNNISSWAFNVYNTNACLVSSNSGAQHV